MPQGNTNKVQPLRKPNDLADLWAKVTPAPEDEGLELAGNELRAMRKEKRVEGGP